MIRNKFKHLFLLTISGILSFSFVWLLVLSLIVRWRLRLVVYARGLLIRVWLWLIFRRRLVAFLMWLFCSSLQGFSLLKDTGERLTRYTCSARYYWRRRRRKPLFRNLRIHRLNRLLNLILIRVFRLTHNFMVDFFLFRITHFSNKIILIEVLVTFIYETIINVSFTYNIREYKNDNK